MASRASVVEYDLHGFVGIRVTGATPADARAVARQLGPFQRPLDREPDIEIRFVERLDVDADLRLIGLDDAAHTAEDFFLLRSQFYSSARVRIPVPDLGGRVVIVCESGLSAVPLLIATINLTALAHGVAPLHASAFSFEGRGVLVVGWSKGGKSETLLAFMGHGAQYIGDEWIYVDPARGRMFGLPQPIRLWDWHLSQLPRYRSEVSSSTRARLASLKSAQSFVMSLAKLAPNGSAPRRLCERAREVFRRQAYVDVAPERLFGPLGSMEATIDRVFLLASHASSDTVLTPTDAATLARRMVPSVHYEFAPLRAYYDMYRYAFPGTSNPYLDSLEETLEAILLRALSNCRAYSVHHPYPFRIAGLFEAMRQHV